MKTIFRQQKQQAQDQIDNILDIEQVKTSQQKLGYLCNFKTVSLTDENLNEISALSCYFIEQSGDWFKCFIKFQPYFYISCEHQYQDQLINFLEKKFEKLICSIEKMPKMNLEQINHLSGKQQGYLKLSFRLIQDLMNVRTTIKSHYDSMQKKKRQNFDISDIHNQNNKMKLNDMLDAVTDIREYDVPYHVRVCIDMNVRAGLWYKIDIKDDGVKDIQQVPEIKERPDLKLLAYDIETSKQPSKFPDASIDVIMMISFMYEGDAFLITNRSYCGQDVEEFDYSPKAEFDCQVYVYNEPGEKELLEKFFNIIKDYKPLIITTFNGDFFDFPFIQERARQHEIPIEKELGIYKEDEEQFIGRFMIHLDCYYWVQRDAYLPQGSQGLKAVTRAKLGYDPIECDPEEMCYFAINKTQQLAEYAISDAVATYFLYKKHIHDFIFALCTIIPMTPDEVLRKGSGTLCENLLMACAFQRNIVFPNKQKQQNEKFFQGHLLDSETYIGGKVECIRSGVFRADFPEKFDYEPESFQTLIDNVDNLLNFVIKVECKRKKEDVANFEEVRNEIIEKLAYFRDVPNSHNHEVEPLIYHLDVAAMYPNIILTNRLQPVAIVDSKTCSGCLYNTEDSDCKRNLQWQWRGEYFPLKRREYEEIKFRLEQEILATAENGQNQLNTPEFEKKLKQRVKQYSQTIYKMVHKTEQSLQEDTVCMRENSFYIDTVRDFRDRRYEFKGLVKKYKGIAGKYKEQGNAQMVKESTDLVDLYESLQLAHKIILNSFYGYVMRKGARWYSMEMAAMVTHIGSQIISDAKAFVDRVGKPLELDTDGIWGMLPKGFPENFNIKFHDGKSYKMEYPCSVLNHLTFEKYCNRQYQKFNEEKQQFDKWTEMSIFFELDGPYKAMIIPAAKEEGKMLKKRYAVFTFQGKLSELKGFELKRRGELNIIKIFQDEIFSKFLKGTNLRECYEACAQVAQKWLNLLIEKGYGLDDDELIHYIGQEKMLSKEISEYGEQKGVGLTAAKRMAEFLGPEIIKGKGLNTHFIISKKPDTDPLSQRAIPIAIFTMSPEIKMKYLRKWLKDSSLKGDVDIRSVLDWEYYRERLESNIQKIVTIPAALQGIKYLMKDVAYPDWLHKVLREQDDKFKQKKLNLYFKKLDPQQKQQQQQILSQKQKQKQEQQKKLQENKMQEEKENKKKDVLKKEELLRNEFDKGTQFKQWLKKQKKIWKEESKLEKPINKKQITHIFKNLEEIIKKSQWQVLGISPCEDLGIYKLWIYLQDKNQLVQIFVEIERIIYINSLEKKSHIQQLQILSKKLPREQKLFNFYKISLSEREYRVKYADFDYYLTNPLVQGVYEQNLSLVQKFLINIGTNAKMNPKIQQKNQLIQNKLSLNYDQLQGIFNPDSFYLSKVDLCYITIYQLKLQQNQLWAIFNPFQNQYRFIRIHKNKDKQNYNAIVKEIISQKFTLNSQTTIRFYDYASQNQALLYIDQYLKETQEIFKSPMLVIFNSKFSSDNIRQYGIKVNSPLLCLKAPQLHKSQYSSLDWQVKGIKYLCSQFIHFPDKIDQLIQLCNYAQIPLCNMEPTVDCFSYITNIQYSRALKNSNSVNWSREYSLKNQITDYSLLLTENQSVPNINKSGLYWSYCVEVDIQMLALNTIALSDLFKNEIKELSMIIEQNEEDNKKSGISKNKNKKQDQQFKYNYNNQISDKIDENVVAKQAFKILKVMVQVWINEVETANNPISDQLLQNIHQWVLSEKNELYEPMLDKMLNKIIDLVFAVLISRLSSFGGEIVFASHEKLIINSGKQTQKEAESYVQYILKTVSQEDLFRYLGLQISRYHQIFLFQDQHNYLGVTWENQEDQPIIEEQWAINKGLSSKLQDYFKLFIISYISDVLQAQQNLQIDYETEEFQQLCEKYTNQTLQEQLYEFIPQIEREIRQQQEQEKLEKMQIENQQYEQEIQQQDQQNEESYYSEEEEEEEYDSEMDDFIVDDGDKEMKKIRKKQKLLEDDNAEETAQNNKIKKQNKQDQQQQKEVIGILKEETSKSVTFINNLINALEFDNNIKDALQLVKRNTLKLLKISDFSEQAIYKDPCLSLPLDNITCKNCQQVITINIFKDEWKCRQCESSIDKFQIQFRLIKYVKNIITGHQIQDLYCQKCKMVKEDQMRERCKCSGLYIFQQTVQNTQTFYKQYEDIIFNLEKIAQQNQFFLLQETLKTISLQ